MLAWVSFILCLILLFKYPVRKLKLKKLNRLMSKYHKQIGYLALFTGIIHGIVAFLKPGKMIMPNLTGILLYVVMIILLLTYILKIKKWMNYHRIFSIILVVLLVGHLFVSIGHHQHKGNKRHARHAHTMVLQ